MPLRQPLLREAFRHWRPAHVAACWWRRMKGREQAAETEQQAQAMAQHLITRPRVVYKQIDRVLPGRPNARTNYDGSQLYLLMLADGVCSIRKEGTAFSYYVPICTKT